MKSGSFTESVTGILMNRIEQSEFSCRNQLLSKRDIQRPYGFDPES